MAQSVQVRKQLCITPTELDVLCRVKSAYWDRRFVPAVFYRFYHRSEKNAYPDLNGLCPRPSICPPLSVVNWCGVDRTKLSQLRNATSYLICHFSCIRPHLSTCLDNPSCCLQTCCFSVFAWLRSIFLSSSHISCGGTLFLAALLAPWLVVAIRVPTTLVSVHHLLSKLSLLYTFNNQSCRQYLSWRAFLICSNALWHGIQVHWNRNKHWL